MFFIPLKKKTVNFNQGELVTAVLWMSKGYLEDHTSLIPFRCVFFLGGVDGLFQAYCKEKLKRNFLVDSDQTNLIFKLSIS